MYIGKVILKNVRGFADLAFDLARPDGSYAGWTVFTGDNGSGKSTLLKAIADRTCRQGCRSRACNRASRAGFGTAALTRRPSSWKSSDALRTTRWRTVVEHRRCRRAFPAKLVLKNGGREITLHSVIPAEKQNQKNYSDP